MISEGKQTNSKNLYKIEYEDSRGIGGCRTKNSPTLWQGFMHLQWNCFHIFTNKRGTYGIIADGLRFATQLSNVYGNAIRAKLAAAQTTRSVAGSFSSFVTQNLQSKRKKKGRSGTDHQRVWDTAEDEPENPDRRFR